MLKKERQAYILHQVNLHNKVLSSLLSIPSTKYITPPTTFIHKTIKDNRPQNFRPGYPGIISAFNDPKNCKIHKAAMGSKKTKM